MALINDIGNRDMAPNINGKEIITDYGSAVIVEYDQSKEKFLVEYTGQDAIGWLTKSQFLLK
ncbi:hypothetical protein AV942_16455 [Alteromonas mediterranea]|uniref:Uncharacterized protein n=2 Tax=Alteromonas mediterranea TaxID=314275 RepID=A0AAC8XN10_9ALTE|nr:hypothetical protein AV942_16455 [Alteromonas mediterranea]